MAHSQTEGYLKKRGLQRADSTYMVETVRELNHLEKVGETLRHALDSLVVVVPEWTRTQSQQEWLEPYGSRVENDRLPKSQAQCDKAACRLGRTDWCGCTGALESHFQ